jgi:hypothetical protein
MYSCASLGSSAHIAVRPLIDLSPHLIYMSTHSSICPSACLRLVIWNLKGSAQPHIIYLSWFAPAHARSSDLDGICLSICHPARMHVVPLGHAGSNYCNTAIASNPKL